MLKKTVTYTNFNDEEVTEDFYFNLSKSEVAELELSRKGGLSSYLQTIIASEDPKEIMSTFREIVRKSIGKRSEDGRRFTKTDEITADFMDSGAYDEIFMELVTNADAGAAFINGIVPKNLSQDNRTVETTAAPQAEDFPAIKKIADEAPAWLRENRDPTEAELRNMGKDELILAMRRKSKSLGSTSDGSAL